MRRLATTIVGALILVGAVAGPAQALPDLPTVPVPGVPLPLPGGDLIPGGTPGVDSIPGVDCAGDVTVGSPDAGPANNIDGGPEKPSAGSPFQDAPDATIYETYGYGGLFWPSLQSGCDLGDLTGDGVAHPGDSAAGTVANVMLTGLAVVVAVAAAVLRFAFAPAGLTLFDPVMLLGVDALGDNLFIPLFWITLFATGIYMATKAARARLVDTARSGGWVLLVAVGAVAAITWPLTVAPLVDQAVTSGVGAVNASIAAGTGSTNLGGADAAAANLHRALLYETWCSGMVGKGDGATAAEFCPKLFATSTFSHAEWEAIKADPSKAGEYVGAKQEAFKKVAADLKDTDPAAYEYLEGKHNTDRIWYALLGWFGLLCAVPFLLVSAVLLIYAMVVIRVAIIAFPAVALVGGYPPLRRYVTGLFDFVVGALFSAVLFGAMAAVFVGMIAAFMSPTNGLHPLLSMVLLGIASYAAWKFTKPFRRMKSMASLKERFGDRPRGRAATGEAAADEPSSPSGSGGGVFAPTADQSRYVDASPAEARPSMFRASVRGAAQGAAMTAAAGLVTGGTATAAGMAAGAARGAGSAAIAHGITARRGSQGAAESRPAPHALPASPTDSTPRVYAPDEATPAVRVVQPTTEGGDRVYPIYTPTTQEADL